MPNRRTLWYAEDLSIKDEPLAKSLLTYKFGEDRRELTPPFQGQYPQPNLVSSRTRDGKQMPVLDVDIPFRIVNSSTEGHGHLYFDMEPISYWRWFCLMLGLKISGVIEKEFFWWSLRRGGNFVRTPDVRKAPEEDVHPTYGWFFKKKDHD